MAPVDDISVSLLINTIQSKLNEGAERFILLISSPGGSVFHGISAYNFLKGIPAEVYTHVYGSADSIATVIYCAGSKRFCVPNARFMLHGIGFTPPPGIRLEEKQVEERRESLRIDRENIAKIIAENCKKSMKEIEEAMFKGTLLNSQQAKEYGLVHEIKSGLFKKGAEVINIVLQKKRG